MRKLLCLVSFGVLFAASTAQADCPMPFRYWSGFLKDQSQTLGYQPNISPFEVRTSKYVIREVSDDRVVVWHEADGQESEVKLDDGVVLQARSKKDFDGRKQIERDDLQAGQKIAVTSVKKDGQVVKIRVLSR